MPPQLGKVTGDDFKAIKNSELSLYLVKQVSETENFYSTDYYSAIMALQGYLKGAIEDPWKHYKTIPPGSGEYPTGETIERIVAISLNNIWDMWWVYWSDGTRTKHKGAAGTYPGDL